MINGKGGPKNATYNKKILYYSYTLENTIIQMLNYSVPGCGAETAAPHTLLTNPHVRNEWSLIIMLPENYILTLKL